MTKDLGLSRPKPTKPRTADEVLNSLGSNVETDTASAPQTAQAEPTTETPPAGPIAAKIDEDDDAPRPTNKLVEKTRKVTGDLPDSLHRKLKLGLIDREGLTINDVIVKAVERYIRNW